MITTKSKAKSPEMVEVESLRKKAKELRKKARQIKLSTFSSRNLKALRLVAAIDFIFVILFIAVSVASTAIITQIAFNEGYIVPAVIVLSTWGFGCILLFLLGILVLTTYSEYRAEQKRRS